MKRRMRREMSLGRALIGLNTLTMCHSACDDLERRCGDAGCAVCLRCFAVSGAAYRTAWGERDGEEGVAGDEDEKKDGALYPTTNGNFIPRISTSPACVSRGINAQFTSAIQPLAAMVLPARLMRLPTMSLYRSSCNTEQYCI